MSVQGNLAGRVTELEAQLRWKQIDLEASRSTEQVALSELAETRAAYERLSTLQLHDRARAVKAERELAEACAQIATLNRVLGEIQGGAGFYGLSENAPAQRMMVLAHNARNGA